MERAEYLLLKMLEQLRRNESKEQLLNGLRLIEAEIERSFPTSNPAPDPTLASVSPIPAEQISIQEETPMEAEREYAVLQLNEEEIDWESEENGNMIVSDLSDEQDQKEEELPVDEPVKEVNIAQSILSRFLTPPPVDALLNPDFVDEKEENEERTPATSVEFDHEPSTIERHQQWNDSSSEWMNRFSASPIKDLRKAIGINDRYRFIHELFKGDETMFERSIKTINDFSIFPEAEFWVRRELKTKLGWNGDDALVQQFDQLVRRRFS